MVSEMGIILLGTPEDVDIVYSAWRHAAVHKRTGNDLRPLSNIRNLQAIPSSSTHAKLIKSCIQPPSGWLLVGADFASLEDRISALTTKDPNKIKVYTGHKLYTLTVNGVTHRISDDTMIRYQGDLYTGAAFYEKYGST